MSSQKHITNEQLQQLISNAVHSALQASGKTSTEAVSTASSLHDDEVEQLSKGICNQRLMDIQQKMLKNKKADQ